MDDYLFDDSDGEDRDRSLYDLIDDELELMIFIKDDLDLEFPDHSRSLGSGRIETMARNKVIHRLCDPSPILGGEEPNTGDD